MFQTRHLTKRAPDKWDSAAFSSIFLASSFFCSQAESQPAHLRVTQTVGRTCSTWRIMKKRVCKFCNGDIKKGKSGLFYWCEQDHMWLTKNSETILVAAQPLRAVDAALPPSAEADSSLVIVPAVESDTQPRI